MAAKKLDKFKFYLFLITKSIVKTYVLPLLLFAGVFSLQILYYFSQVNKKQSVSFLQEEKRAGLLLSLDQTSLEFGFSNLIADWHFLKFVQYFGDKKAREQTGYSLTTSYFKSIVNRDPHFVKAHLTLSTANSIYAGRPKQTVLFLNQVLSYISPNLPLAYYLWVYKGIDEILFLGDLKAAQRSYEMAAEWANYRDESAKSILAVRARETARFLAKKPDSRKARIGAWTTILMNATDEKTQQRATQEIKALGGEIIITPEGRLSVEVQPEK
ncbi:MAG: hypothetical protein ACFB4I_02900 [Cyanophyceae cyanobacterium]